MRRLAVSVLAAVALAGCTSGEPNQPGQREEPTPSAQSLAYRDRPAVLAALRELDTCELLLAASAGLITPPPGGPEPSLVFPADCSVASDSTGRATVSIDVFDIWPQPVMSLIGEDRRVLGGALAFVDDDRPTRCEVALPVSPETAIEVRASDPAATTSPCALAEAVAETLDETLDDPGRMRAAPRWGPCDALMAAHGGTSDRYQETFTSATCTDTSSDATFSFQAGEPGASGAESPGSTPWRSEQVAGTEVWFSDNPAKGICEAQWAAGPLGSPYSFNSSDVLMAEVSAETCADARALAEPLVGVLQQPPPEVAPQRPVLYPA